MRGLLVVVLCLGTFTCGCGRTDFDASTSPAAVILVREKGHSQLVVVDLDRFEIVRKVRLRSHSYSIDGDPATRTIATAQCGGLGADTDDACGIYRLGDRDLSYVGLAVPNPYDVAVSDGHAYLVHGFMQQEGLSYSVVDLAVGKLTHSGHVPGMTSRIERAAGVVVAPVGMARAEEGVSDVAQPAGLLRLNGSEIATLASDLGLDSCTLVRSERDSRLLTAGRAAKASGDSGPAHALLAVDARTGEVTARVGAPWMDKEAETACLTADGIAIADVSAVDPQDTGHSLVFLDLETLEPVMRRTLEGMPAAVAGWGKSTLVVDGAKGTLLLFEKGRTTPSKALKVTSDPDLIADLVVLDRRAASAGSGDSVDTPR